MPTAYENDPQFSKLLRRDDDVDLVRLMLEFAGDAYANLDVAAPLAELDRLGAGARAEVDACPAGGLATRLACVSRLLYEREGFRGNEQQYYDPRNSYLNEVLSRRRGIPISLAIVYTVVANAAGLPAYGVGTPGHFLVGCDDRGEHLFVDPFAAGEVLDKHACRRRIERVLGEAGVLGEEHFRPATVLEIAARVLRNLKAAYAMDNNWPAALPVQLRLASLLPEVADERRDLGLIYLRNGEAHQALALLEQYQRSADADQAAAVAPYVKAARRLAAERN